MGPKTGHSTIIEIGTTFKKAVKICGQKQRSMFPDQKFDEAEY